MQLGSPAPADGAFGLWGVLGQPCGVALIDQVAAHRLLVAAQQLGQHLRISHVGHRGREHLRPRKGPALDGFGRLPTSEFNPRQRLAANLRQSLLEASSVVVSDAIVEPEHLFVQIPLHVERL